MPVEKSCDFHVESEVLTAGSIAEVVNSILEFLLYQRNQIPMVYPKYRYFVNSWSEMDDEDLATRGQRTLNNFQLERQRDLAKKTKEAISEMRQLIHHAFEQGTVRRLRFLFGATSFTAKEAYTIHIPTEKISRKHNHVHHPLPNGKLNQALMQLMTNDDLYTIFSLNLPPTNVYLELEVLDDSWDCWKRLNSRRQLSPKDASKLPDSCKMVNLHVLHKWPETFCYSSLQCCSEMQIFEDDERSYVTEPINETDVEIQAMNENCQRTTPSWWEADVCVRGFQEKPIKGINMWMK